MAAQLTTPSSTDTPHWLDKLCSSPMTGGRTLPTSLPPELRNNIYIEYLNLCPRAVLHQPTGNVVPQGSLIRVSRQLRQEVGSLNAYFVTDLVFTVKDRRFEKLTDLLGRLDKRTVEGFRRPESTSPERPTQAQLAVATRAQTLRPSRANCGISGIRQYPTLRQLVVRLDLEQEPIYFYFYWWSRLVATRAKRWSGINVGYEVVQGSNITQTVLTSFRSEHRLRQHPFYNAKGAIQHMEKILAVFEEYVAATRGSG